MSCSVDAVCVIIRAPCVMVAAVVAVCGVMLICRGCSCQVGCAETVRLNKAAQAAHQDLCAWQILFRSLLPGSGPMHIPLSLPPATEGLVLSAARDQDLHCDIQLRGH